MRTNATLVTLVAMLVVGLGSAAPARAGSPASPPTGTVLIDVVTVNGSGCPAHNVAVTMAPDNTYFNVIYSNYLVQVGVGAQPTDSRKNCQLNLLFHLPAGFTFAIAESHHGGYVQLADGATATERARDYRPGDPAPAWKSHTFVGPLNDEWQATDAPVTPLSYVPCGTPPRVVLQTELRVNAGTSDPDTTTSFMAFDTVDAGPGYASTYHLDWAAC